MQINAQEVGAIHLEVFSGWFIAIVLKKCICRVGNAHFHVDITQIR